MNMRDSKADRQNEVNMISPTKERVEACRLQRGGRPFAERQRCLDNKDFPVMQLSFLGKEESLVMALFLVPGFSTFQCNCKQLRGKEGTFPESAGF